MAINVNELILDKVRSLIFTDLADGSAIGRLTKLEDPSLQTAAEAEEVTDAQGALITKLFRAKTGRFEATNSLFSMDLLAQQYGSEKEVANETTKIVVPCEETLEVASGKVTLSHTPSNEIKYIYKLENGTLAQKYTLGSSATANEFTTDGAEITVPTGVTGKIYVEYEYEATSAVRVVNNTENFPSAVGVKIFVIFKDQCNENIKYAGTPEHYKLFLVLKQFNNKLVDKDEAKAMLANIDLTGRESFKESAKNVLDEIFKDEPVVRKTSKKKTVKTEDVEVEIESTKSEENDTEE